MATFSWPTAGKEEVDRALLASIPIFAGLPPELLERFVQAGNMMSVPADCVLLKEGEPARSLLVVCEGELEIRKRGANGADVRLAVLRAGDCVGEMSLIDIQPRSATVASLTPARLFRLEHKEIGKLHRSHAEVYTFLVMNIAREISRRLRRADELLAEMGVAAQGMWSGAGEKP